MPDPTHDPAPPRRRIPPALASLLVALALVIVAFPEVVFLGGSLSPTGLNPVIEGHLAKEEEQVQVYPDPEYSEARSGLVDIGARAWQLEPATKFMNRTIYDGDSPSWNPYSAAGSYGPETLADIKLSPFVLAVAVLGASSTTFTFVMLVLIALGLYCLQQFFTRTLGMSRLAGVGACVIYLLNGWAAAIITSQTSAPYVLFPVVLYTFTEYQRVGGRLRFLASVAAHAALFATTFVPGVVLVLILVHSVALLLEFHRRGEADEGAVRRSIPGVFLHQAIVPGLALLVTAYIWLPNIAALLNAGDEMLNYSEIDLPTKRPIEALTLLTPRQYFRGYIMDSLPEGVRVGSWTTYLGIVPLVAVFAALPRARSLGRKMLVLTLAVAGFAILMHLGVPGVRSLGELPLLKPISGTYWASLVGAALAIAFGVAVETAHKNGLSVRAAMVTGAVMLAAFAAGFASEGLPERQGLKLGIAAALATIVVAVLFVWLASWRSLGGVLLAAMLLVLAAGEMLSYGNHTRVKRFDYEDREPAYLTYVKDNVGDQRVYVGGRGAMYPEWGSALGVRQIESMNLMQMPWYRDFFLTYINPFAGYLRFLQNGHRPNSAFAAVPRALDLLSVRYLVVDSRYEAIDQTVAARYPLVFEDEKTKINVYENNTAFPRAYVSTAIVDEDEQPLGPLLWSTGAANTRDQGLLAEAQDAGITSKPRAAAPTGQIVEEDNDRVVVQVDSPAAGVLVLGDTYHDNWQATVNGERQDVGLVNEYARGVVVPEGTSTVVFEYRSRPRQIGAVISVMTVLALLIGTALSALLARRRRNDDGTLAPDEEAPAPALETATVGDSPSPPVG